MANITRQDVERLLQQKLAELNHMEITLKKEFTSIVDASLEYLIKSDILPNKYSRALQLIDRLSKGTIKSAISRGLGSIIGHAITFDTIRATHAAMEEVLKWLDNTNEQDPDKIGYIIDEYIRFYSVYYGEDSTLEDSSILKQFEPDLAFRKYRK
ncbi:unnamed protein product [Adineta steineri]|uniref:Uncharacterized protein n=1 Tax=Adineta steineri TaxID=433720 RepID=A0A815I233_9BILA|nr:unnamed protein product [Adineta steineri]CAF1358066.1 unnamed protein product [Adineta steineri]CAF1383741.1 unnamed protein product [Adineta steineri]CAF1455753.1 unnamed protein product [Adineta steineri]CAF1585970.1 unnamed protein product [Adineta steineri]